MTCIASNDLAAFVDGRLPQRRASRLRMHVGGCTECTELFHEMAAPVVDSATRKLARRHGLDHHQEEELRSLFWIKIIENRILETFEGRSRLNTFLFTSVARLFIDWKRSRYGRWRPSMAARKLGPAAETLERSLVWERRPLNSALRELHARFPDISEADVQQFLEKIKTIPRPRVVGEDGLAEVSATDSPADELERRFVEGRTKEIIDLIAHEIRGLSCEDRVLLKLRFMADLPVTAIARTVDRSHRRLYRKFERMFREIRQRLEEAGITSGDIEGVLADPSADLELALAGIIDAKGDEEHV